MYVYMYIYIYIHIHTYMSRMAQVAEQRRNSLKSEVHAFSEQDISYGFGRPGLSADWDAPDFSTSILSTGI